MNAPLGDNVSHDQIRNSDLLNQVHRKINVNLLMQFIGKFHQPFRTLLDSCKDYITSLNISCFDHMFIIKSYLLGHPAHCAPTTDLISHYLIKKQSIVKIIDFTSLLRFKRKKGITSWEASQHINDESKFELTVWFILREYDSNISNFN